MRTRKILSAVLVSAGVLFASLALNSLNAACANNIATTTCDAAVWQTMVDRATLETEREVMQNQNLIFAADSVTQYVCLDNLVAHAAQTIGPIFTHTAYFNGTVVVPQNGDYGMGNVLNEVVVQALRTHVNQNIRHSYLGGRANAIPQFNTRTFENVGNAGRAYQCGEMALVWARAKCLNFMHIPAFATQDGFFPFKDFDGVAGYSSKGDVRQWPEACGASPAPVQGGWALKTDQSRNVANARYQYEQPNAAHFEAVRLRLQPGTCSGAIRTGVPVLLSATQDANIEDGVCSNPGCTFIGNACVPAGGAGGSGAEDPDIVGPQ